MMELIKTDEVLKNSNLEIADENELKSTIDDNYLKLKNTILNENESALNYNVENYEIKNQKIENLATEETKPNGSSKNQWNSTSHT